MKITIRPRLNIIVLEKKIKTATNLAKVMTEAGYKLSTSQAARYMNDDPPPAMSADFIETACNVFQCLPNELFDITLEVAQDETIDPLLAIPQHAKRITGSPVQAPVQMISNALPAKKKLPWEGKFGAAGPTLKPLPSPNKNK